MINHNYMINNYSPVNGQCPVNGNFSESILLRYENDTYIFIPNCEVIIVNRTNKKKEISITEQFNQIINQYSDKNIILDNRLVDLINYSLFTFGPGILIYDILDKKVYNTYAYLAKLLTIPMHKLNPLSFPVYGIICFVMEYSLNNMVALDKIKLVNTILLGHNKEYLTMDMFIDNMLNYNMIKQEKTSNKNIMEIYNFLYDLFKSISEKDFNRDFRFIAKRKNEITRDEICSTFMLLLSKNITVKI